MGEKPQASAVSKQPKLWTVSYALLVVIILLSFTVGQGLNAGTSSYMSVLGYGSALSGMFALVFSFAAATVRILVGPVVDRGHASLIMRLGFIVLLAGTTIPLFTENVIAMGVARALQGIGFSVGTTAASGAASQVLPRERLGEGIGYLGLGQALAMSIGPAMAFWLVGTDYAASMFIGFTLVVICGFMAAMALRYEKHPEKLPPSSAFRRRYEMRVAAGSAQDGGAEDGEAVEASADDAAQPKERIIDQVFEKKALAGAIPQLVYAPAFAYCVYFLGLYGPTIGVDNVSLFFVISAASMLIMRLNSGKFMDTVAPIKVFTVAVLCGIAAYALLIAAADNTWLLYVAGVLQGCMSGLASPSNQTVAIKNSPMKRYGAATGMFLLAVDLGVGISCVIWGTINDIFGFQVSMASVIVTLVISYIAAWICYPKPAKDWNSRGWNVVEIEAAQEAERTAE